MKKGNIDATILDDLLQCEDCGDVYTLYVEGDIFHCKNCRVKKLFRTGKNITPEMIKRVMEKYK
jgi:hypothetical protein